MEHSPALSICAQIFQKVKIKFKEIRQLFSPPPSNPQDISCSKMTKMSLSLCEGRVTKQTGFVWRGSCGGRGEVLAGLGVRDPKHDLSSASKANQAGY